MAPPDPIRKAVEGTMLALAGPIVVWPGFEDSLPKHIKDQIPLQRLLQSAKGEDGMATDVEAVAYLMTASLARPMSGDWAAIYLKIATDYLGDSAPKEFRKAHSSITKEQQEKLDGLKRWIRKKQVEQMKGKPGRSQTRSGR